ncbi:MAG TPA: T9SS type A sorting domain-containing protein [Segetibacter sp.]|jgi:hypothetical protein
MNKLYLFLFFIALTSLVAAQEQKPAENNSGSELFKAKVVKFYPNPATAVINFEFLKPVPRDLVLQVYNFIGKKVYELTTVSQKTAVPLNDFYRGMYIFQLRDKSGRIVESGKFQVAK